MLQVAVYILFFVMLFPYAVSAQDNVPAFLRNEAVRQQYEHQRAVPQQNNNVPAFMQMEMQQQQFNYQSANPDSDVFTLPPVQYNPAQGEVPAFMVQQPVQPAPQEVQPVRTDSTEDAIRINFSEDQYKEDEEVTTLTPDQAMQYNTEAAVKEEKPQAESEEAEEGVAAAPAVDKQKQEEIEKEKQAEKQAVPEPKKSSTNLMRISYSHEATELADNDKQQLLALVRELRGNNNSRILIKSYTSESDIGADVRRVGLLRIIGIREYLMKQGVDFSRTEARVLDGAKNKEGLDYIDIDKI